MASPSFSVVIPTYNRADLLPSAVRSALVQTYQPLEVVVVDDGSTDHTAGVCAGFDSPVRCIHQKNAGVSAARNRGVRESKGEVVAFLDSDDVWEPEKLEIHAAVHARWPEVEWAISDSLIVDDDLGPLPGPQGFVRGFPVLRERGQDPEAFFGSSLGRESLTVADRCFPVYRGDAFGLLLQGNFVQPSALTVHRELFERSGGFDEELRMAVDTELAPRLAARGQMAVIMSPLVRWRIGEHESIVKPERAARLTANALLSLERAAGLKALSPAEQRAYDFGLGTLWLRLAYELLSDLEGRKARQCLSFAFRAGVRRSPRALGIWGASFLPRPVLRGLHLMKRLLN